MSLDPLDHDKVPKYYLSLTGAFFLVFGMFLFLLACIVGIGMNAELDFSWVDRLGDIAMGLFGYYIAYVGLYRLKRSLDK